MSYHERVCNFYRPICTILLKKIYHCLYFSANKAKTAIVSLWDFAGQFVYYATHQLFFSPRSIYLLVVNMEDGELDKTLDGWYMDLTGKDSIEAQGTLFEIISS
jgi:GTPase SAR1 family protein